MKFVKFKNSLIVKTNNSYVFLKVNNTDDGKEVEWITVRGNHIPIKKGQSKEEAIKSFIESKRGSGKGGKPSGIKFKEFVDKAGEKYMRALIERNGGKVDAKKEDGFVSGKIYAPEGKKIRGTKEDVFASFEVREEDFEDFVNKRLGKDSKYFEERSEGGSDKGNERREKEAPPKVGTVGFGKEIRRYFDYDKIPQQSKEKASDIYRKYQDVYHTIYEKGMDKIQENLDRLSIEYGDKVADLVGEKSSSAREKTNRMDNPPEEAGTGFFDSLFKSRYGRISEDKKEKAKEIYSEFKKEYSNIYERGMGKIHTLLDKINSDYGEKIHKLEED